MEKTPFWKKTWFIILMLCIVPPLGIVLMWTCKKDWKNIIRIILSVIFGIWTLLWGIILFVPANESSSASNEPATFEEAITEPFTRKPDAVTLPVENTTAEEAAGNTEPETTEKQTTTKPTTTKSPTTKPSAVTKPVATTKKVTTTAKPTTTKAPTTTKPTTTKAPTTVSQNTGTRYILNTDTMKFHYMSCSYAENINAENKEIYQGSRQSLIEQKYSPCGHCNP